MHALKTQSWSFASLILLGFLASSTFAQSETQPPGEKKQQNETQDAGKRKSRINVFQGRVLDHKGQPVAGASVGVVDSKRGFLSVWGGRDGKVFAHGPDEKLLFFFSKPNGKRADTTNTDKKGRFSIRNLKHGNYTLLAHHSDIGVAIIKSVEFNKAASSVVVRLNAPTYVEGKLKGLPFIPTQESCLYSIELQPEGLPDRVYFSPQVEPDSDGHFKVGPLPDATSWNLVVEELVAMQRYNATLLKAPVQAQPGKTSTLNVDLTEGSSFSGEVLGPKGESLSGVSVVALESGEMGRSVGAVTNSKGKYTLTGLPDGKYTLQLRRWIPRTAPG